MKTEPGRDTGTGTDEAMSGFVRDAIRDMVELQLRENKPPEIGLNVERLVAAGFLHEEALSLVACALSREMFNALDTGKPFDLPRYLERVAMLPAAPWDDDRPLSPCGGEVKIGET